ERNARPLLNQVAAVHRSPFRAGALISKRLPLHHIARRRVYYQVALGIKFSSPRAREVQGDCMRVGARRNNEVVLQAALAAVVRQVYAGIYILIFDAAKGRDIAVPL